MPTTRRHFIASSIFSSLAFRIRAVPARNRSQVAAAENKAPIIICASNGFKYLDEAYEMLRAGADSLDTALRVVRGAEDDPNDDTVGLGGLPNEEGVVELDACCMHGPTRRAGSVGAVRNIRNVSLVAKAVMEHTGHVMLVGEGAEQFAMAAGFARENLLTERSRKIWFLWKQFHSDRDWWGPGLASPYWKKPDDKTQSALSETRLQMLYKMAADSGIAPELRSFAMRQVLYPPTGTIHCSALNGKGVMSGCTTTSGLAFKISGRLGDSPIIGAGCYTDQDIGSAGATGSGEENIKVAGAHTIIENMRHGMSPRQAGMDALKRVVRNYRGDMQKLRYMDMKYYVLRKDGAYAGVSLWEGYGPDDVHKIAVHDGTARLEPTVALFKGYSQEFPNQFRVVLLGTTEWDPRFGTEVSSDRIRIRLGA